MINVCIIVPFDHLTIAHISITLMQNNNRVSYNKDAFLAESSDNIIVSKQSLIDLNPLVTEARPFELTQTILAWYLDICIIFHKSFVLTRVYASVPKVYIYIYIYLHNIYVDKNIQYVLTFLDFHSILFLFFFLYRQKRSLKIFTRESLYGILNISEYDPNSFSS